MWEGGGEAEGRDSEARHGEEDDFDEFNEGDGDDDFGDFDEAEGDSTPMAEQPSHSTTQQQHHLPPDILAALVSSLTDSIPSHQISDSTSSLP